MNYKTIIVDDEILAIENLKMVLESYPEIHVIGEATNKDDAVLMIDRLHPDVVFLDINLVSSNGFLLLDELKFRDFQLVFVTAHDEYAVKAFEYGATNYLLKPLQTDAVSKVVDNLKKKVNSLGLDSAAMAKLTRLLEQKDENIGNTKIVLSTPKGVVLRDVSDIMYIRSSGNYCFVHFQDKTKVLVSKTMKEMEAQLVMHNFFRIHHSVLMNCNLVKSYVHKDGQVWLISGEELTVSFRKRSAFKRFLRGDHVS